VLPGIRSEAFKPSRILSAASERHVAGRAQQRSNVLALLTRRELRVAGDMAMIDMQTLSNRLGKSVRQREDTVRNAR
jgi:hypothetical protein